MSRRILVTGAAGQIGSVLVPALRKQQDVEAVYATDIRESAYLLDVLDAEDLEKFIVEHKITEIYHMAAILSAKGEQDPLRTWHVNMNATLNILDAAVKTQVRQVFFPSSIAVFDQGDTPVKAQNAVRLGDTVYGISKTAGENWCQYYYHKYGLDVRSLRYPGIIGYQSAPGGGTTDYAVEIFHSAIQTGHYTCYLKPNTFLPMIYMDDAVRATIELMAADAKTISVRTSYNLAAMSFSPAELTQAIQRYIPDFQIDYCPDYRQAIADNWPMDLDDSQARHDWGWQPQYNLATMTADMLKHLTPILTTQQHV